MRTVARLRAPSAARDNGAGRQVQRRPTRAIAVVPASTRSCVVESARLGCPRPNRYDLVMAGLATVTEGRGREEASPMVEKLA
jgi:hypothetical protein